MRRFEYFEGAWDIDTLIKESFVFKQNQHRAMRSVIEKMKGEEVDPGTGRGYYDKLGVDAVSLFRNRYRSSLELLNLVRNSRTLSFQGGIQK